jgi:hypothetical protein
MDLRRRSKNRVRKAIAGKPDMAMGKELARANGDYGVDRVNSVAEGGDEAAKSREPRAARNRWSKGSSPIVLAA